MLAQRWYVDANISTDYQYNVPLLSGKKIDFKYTLLSEVLAKVQIRIACAPKIAFMFIPIYVNRCLDAQKNLIEMVLLSTNNICFGWETRKKSSTHSYLQAWINLVCWSEYLPIDR